MKTLLQLLLIGIVIMLFSKCYTSDKAQKQVDKANAKFPDIVAKLARDKYPCRDLLKPDTVITYADSLIFIECPDSNYTPNDYGTVVGNGGIGLPTSSAGTVKVETRTVKVPVKILVPSKVINNWYEDSAKIKLLTIDIDKLQKENTTLKADKENLQDKVDKRNKWLLWLIILCVLLTLWTIRKIFI